MPEIHSTGRGGAGNIGEDPTIYTDGSIVREGPEGLSATQAEYSTGRGGAGNIDGRPKSGTPVTATNGAAVVGTGRGSGPASRTGSPAVGPMRRTDEDVIPEPAMHPQHQANFHTGRGGQGNVHKDKYGGHSKPQTTEHLVKEHGLTEAEAAAQKKEKQRNGVGDKVKALFGSK